MKLEIECKEPYFHINFVAALEMNNFSILLNILNQNLKITQKRMGQCNKYVFQGHWEWWLQTEICTLVVCINKFAWIILSSLQTSLVIS